MVKASTFKEIDKEYKIFRAEFINMEGFEEMQKSDRIISRCIAELLTLIDVEENYPNYKIRKPYSFFVNHLSKTKYLAQNEKNGVEIYPYRTAAAAPFKVHIVIGATQDDLAVGAMFKQLNFLNENKRKVIMELNPDKKANISKFIELDPTEDFITLYTLGTEASYFTSSKGIKP